jgi:predicted O-methyltransferase YrrM
MTGEVADAVRLLRRSTRQIVREARARYTTDLVKWHHREAFDGIWQVVDRIPGWFGEGSAALMYELMCATPPQTVVEIGSYLGRSTSFFALTLRQVNPHGRVVAVDPHTGDRQQLECLAADHLATFELFQQHLQATGIDDVVEPRVATSLEVADGWADPVDLLYVDGWHSYDAVMADGRAWLPHLEAGGVVVFDDYVAYPEVRAAVEDLAASGAVRVWGSAFGQAIGGVAEEPPPALRRALRLSLGRR